MNQQLLETWEKIQAFLKTSIQQIENSVWFERVLIRYESADPRTQRRVVAGLRLSVAVTAILAVLMPLWAVIGAKRTLSGQRAVLAEIRAFNEEQASVPERPRPPSDWQNLPAETPDQLKSSLTQYLSSINLPEGSFVLDGGFGSEMNLRVDELNLRQAMALLFQLDGWFPRVQLSRMKLAVHPEKKDLTSLTVALNHRPGGSAGGGAASDGDWEPDADLEAQDAEFTDDPPTRPTTMPRTNRPGAEGSEDEGFTDEPPIFDEPPPTSGRGNVSPPPESNDDDFDFDDEGADDGADLPPPPFEGGDL